MSRALRRLLAGWFVLQIALPFTAPLQTCDLGDLFGPLHHHSTAASFELTSTPTDADLSMSPVAAGALKTSLPPGVDDESVSRRLKSIEEVRRPAQAARVTILRL